jgi:hypothetical protein
MLKADRVERMQTLLVAAEEAEEQASVPALLADEAGLIGLSTVGAPAASVLVEGVEQVVIIRQAERVEPAAME